MPEDTEQLIADLQAFGEENMRLRHALNRIATETHTRLYLQDIAREALKRWCPERTTMHKCQRCRDTGKYILETFGGDTIEMTCEHPRCCWWQDEDGVWDTACDNRHEFIEDGPKENHYHFCPYCGKPLEVYVMPSEPTVGNESI